MRRTGIIFLCMVGALMLGYGNTSAEPVISNIPHTVLKEDVYDGAGKAQIIQNLLVNPNISETDLRDLLNSRFNEASQRSGFEFFTHPTVVVIYAYPSRELANSGKSQWVGMLIKYPTNSAPKITIS